MPHQQQLSREVLKWIQGLDLAFAIKNIRRDFSNGFLVAEIFSRYFPQYVQMHSFDPGSSKVKQQDNWKLLVLMFRKIGFVLRQERKVVEGVMNKNMESVLEFTNSMYTFLTTRTVCTKKAPRICSVRNRKVGPVGRNTPSRVEASMPPETSIAAAQSKLGGDEDIPPSFIEDSVSQSLRAPSKVLKGEKRQVAVSTSEVRVQTGTVNIKTLETSDIVKLRTDRGGGIDGSHASMLDESKYGEGLEGKQNSVASHMSEFNNPFIQTPLKILDRAMREALGSKSGFSVKSFLAELTSLTDQAETVLSQQDVDRVFRVLRDGIESLCQSCLEFPSEWCIVGAAISNAFTLKRWDLTNAGPVLASVGECYASNNIHVSFAMFFDVCFPKMKSLLIDGSIKEREQVVAIFASYYPPTVPTHTKALRTLGRHLKNSKAFLQSVASLMHLTEGAFVLTPSDQLCSYLGRLGLQHLSHSSPSVRSASLGVLCRVISDLTQLSSAESKAEEKANDEIDNIVTSLVNSISVLVVDPWWETQAQLVQMGCKLLATTKYSSEALKLLRPLLDEQVVTSSEQTRKIICGLLARDNTLALHSQFVQVFFKLVSSLGDEARQELLFRDEEPFMVDVPSIIFGNRRFEPLPNVWPASYLVSSICNGSYVFEDVLRVGEVDMLVALLKSSTSNELADSLFGCVSVPLLKSLERTREPETASKITHIMCEVFPKNLDVNVYVHPQWPSVLHNLFKVGETKTADDTEDSDPAIATCFVEAIELGSEDLSASARVTVEETVVRFPSLRHESSSFSRFLDRIGFLVEENSHK